MTARLCDAIFVRGRTFEMASVKQNKERLPYAGTEGGRFFGQEGPYLKWLMALMPDPEKLPAEILKLDNFRWSSCSCRRGRWRTASRSTPTPGRPRVF